MLEALIGLRWHTQAARRQAADRARRQKEIADGQRWAQTIARTGGRL